MHFEIEKKKCQGISKSYPMEEIQRKEVKGVIIQKYMFIGGLENWMTFLRKHPTYSM